MSKCPICNTLEPEGCFWKDTVIKGEPIKGNPIRNVKSFECCKRKCWENYNKTKKCNYFVWNSGKGPGKRNKKNKNTCWLFKNKEHDVSLLIKKGLVKKKCGKKCTGKIAGFPC